MNAISIARRLRRDQTDEEKAMWRALKAGRFAGFTFRRQHPEGKYFLDFYMDREASPAADWSSTPMKRRTSSRRPSPPSDGGEGVSPNFNSVSHVEGLC
jgi:hypothetical protein